MPNLLRDVLFGLRLLGKNPGFTAVAVLTLALGIGANTAIFSVVYGTLLEPLPYHDPEQLVMVWSKPQPDSRNSVAAGDYLDWKAQSTVFQGLHAWTGRDVSLAIGNDRPEQIFTAARHAGLDRQLRPAAAARTRLHARGRRVRRNDQRDPVATASGRSASAATARSSARQIRLDGKPHTVVGVLGPGPGDRVEHKMYLPLAFKPEQINHDFHWLLVMGRLKPGVTLAQANAEMAGHRQPHRGRVPRFRRRAGASASSRCRTTSSRRTRSAALWFLLAGVGFVLLIACANVANLLLARGAGAAARGGAALFARRVAAPHRHAVPRGERRAGAPGRRSSASPSPWA